MVALAPNTSETSPWDVLDTFPKLHSRAREAMTPRCTEAPHSKSLGRVEIWLMIYESRGGLEFFTRDPIGFKGSPYDLYEFVDGNPLGKTDPSGMACWCGETAKCLATFGPLNCLLGSNCRDSANSASQGSGLPGPHNGPQDAFRHCVWSCCMTKSVGESTAKGIVDIHEECGRNSVPAEVVMDQFNNEIGRIIGMHHSGSCSSNCLSMLEGGGLQTSPGPGGPDRNRDPYNGNGEPLYGDPQNY